MFEEEKTAKESAIKITAIPGAIIGGLISKNINKKSQKQFESQLTPITNFAPSQSKINKNIKQNHIEPPKKIGGYYSDVKNLINNLVVMFTPVSVIFSVKNKLGNLTLDTIETGEMNEEMLENWRRKNEAYFKNIFVNKMLSDLQIAELEFARNYLSNSTNVKNGILKKSSEYEGKSIDCDTTNDSSMVLAAEMFDDMDWWLEKTGEEKVLDMLISASDTESEIGTVFDSDFQKYANVSRETNDYYSFKGNINKVKNKLADTKYVMRNTEVGFFPDRVIFHIKNNLISTLPVTNMNADGFEHFNNQDEKYFKDYFVNEVKKIKKESLEKSAEEAENTFNSNPSELFLSSDTHPVAIYLAMNQFIGTNWITYDIMIIEDILKKEFLLKEIPDTTMNKIYCILMANQSDGIYTNAYTFEKAVLSFASKPVDFSIKEDSLVEPEDIAFAIDVLDRVTPYDDIYDNFSEEVLGYIAAILAEKEIYLYSPSEIVYSPLEAEFNDLLNEILSKKIKEEMTRGAETEVDASLIRIKCENIIDSSKMIIDVVRRKVKETNKEISLTELSTIIDNVLALKEIKNNALIVKNQVITNMGIDMILNKREADMQSQLQLYKITSPKEVMKSEYR